MNKQLLNESTATPFLKFYKAAESNIDPVDSVLYDCLGILKEYFDNYIKWYSHPGRSKTKQKEVSIYNDFLKRQKEINHAIVSNDRKEMITAIDTGINQWHYDFPIVKHLEFKDEEGEDTIQVKKDFEELQEILFKIGRLSNETPYIFESTVAPLNDLEQSFIPKKELNPIFFNKEEKLHSKIRTKLLEISENFIKSLNLEDTNIEVKDIILAGSLANYNWSKYSDIDLHVVFDFKQINENKELVEEFFMAKKSLWNLKYDVKIYGYDVEIYGQDINDDFFSDGIYSLLKDEWVSVPEKENHTILFKKILKKAKYISKIINNLIELKIDDKRKLELIDKLEDKISKTRQIGLENEGEYSEENILFKILRRTGYIQKLKDYKQELKTIKLSLNESSVFKPRRIEERLLNLKKEFDQRIVFDGSKKLLYKGNVKERQLYFLEKFYKNYIINVNGDVKIYNMNLKEIPIQFGTIDGSFDCSYNQLTNLKGCPKRVYYNFDCTENNLTSLDGCPKEVDSFECPKNFTKEDILEYCKVDNDQIYIKQY